MFGLLALTLQWFGSVETAVVITVMVDLYSACTFGPRHFNNDNNNDNNKEDFFSACLPHQVGVQGAL